MIEVVEAVSKPSSRGDGRIVVESGDWQELAVTRRGRGKMEALIVRTSVRTSEQTSRGQQKDETTSWMG
jgi:hypothetical protein